MSNQVLPNTNSARTVDPKAGVTERADQRPASGADPKASAGSPAASAGIWAIIDRQSRENRLDRVSQQLFGGGVIALAVLAVSTLLSWVSLSQAIGQLSFSQSVPGIQTTPGVLVLLLSLGAGAFAGFTFINKKDLFLASIYTAAGWGALGFLYVLWKVVQLGSFAGFGLYLGTLAALAAGACFGVLAFRLRKEHGI
jgi:hypothetical protein